MQISVNSALGKGLTFTVDNLRFARKSSEILTLANSLTVLQTYRQAFSFPQTSCIYGIFLSQVEYGNFCSQLEYGIFRSQVVKSCKQLESENSRIQVESENSRKQIN